MSKKEVYTKYLNAKQLKFQKSRARRKTFNGGRGSGKTHILGVDQYECFWELPRALCLMAGLTYVQLDMIVLPGITAALESLGFEEYTKDTPWGVYVIGVRPPDNWVKCLQKVGKRGYQYRISFINGYTIQFVSQDNPDTHRGINSDLLRVDESATMDEEFINKVLVPSMRANAKTKLSLSYKHRSFYDFSSASWTPEGNWIYKTENLYTEMMAIREKMSYEERKKTPPSVLFLQSTYRDNQENLPDDYGAMLFDTLTELQFMVEVENERITKVPNCYYFAFSNSKHTYTKSFDYEFDDKMKIHVYRSNDVRPDKPLECSLDFNANICWTITCQEIGREFRIVDSQFEKSSVLDTTKNVIKVNAENWCKKYQSHEKKVVHIWGDKSGANRNAGSEGDNLTFFAQYISVLKLEGWEVIEDYKKQPRNPPHKSKYILNNHLLEESQERTPRIRFNQNTNKVLIISIGRTPIKTDGTFKKHKAEETAGDGVQNREYAPDGTDALDYILWGKFRKFMPMAQNQRNQFDTV